MIDTTGEKEACSCEELDDNIDDDNGGQNGNDGGTGGHRTFEF